MLHLCPKSYAAQTSKLACAMFLLAAFGCATVRAPLSSFDEPRPARSGAIEPQLEFWLESGDSIPADEQDAAAQDARAALDQIVGIQTISPHALGAADPLLVVRERAVARTSSRRTNQTVAKVGIVAGAVLVVVALAAGAGGHGGAKSGSGGSGHHTIALGSHAASSGPRGAPASAFAWSSRRAGPPRIPSGPYFRGGSFPRHPLYAPAAEAFSDLIDPRIELAFDMDEANSQRDFSDGDRYGADDFADASMPEPPRAPAALELPEMPELLLSDRTFFSGDDTQLELDLFDRASGELLWSNFVEKDIDARDRGDLGELFAAALDKQPWAQARR